MNLLFLTPVWHHCADEARIQTGSPGQFALSAVPHFWEQFHLGECNDIACITGERTCKRPKLRVALFMSLSFAQKFWVILTFIDPIA